MAKYSLVMTPTPCRVDGCITSIRYSCTYLLIYLLTYLLTQLLGAYKIGNISKTVEDRAKVTINVLCKVVHGLSIAAKMYDLEWPLREIQGHYSLNAAKMAKYSLVMTPTPCRVFCPKIGLNVVYFTAALRGLRCYCTPLVLYLYIFFCELWHMTGIAYLLLMSYYY